MLQAFYYTHHIPAAELAVDVIEAAPYRLSLDMDLEQDVPVKITDETIPVKVTIDRTAGFTDNVDLVLGKKNRPNWQMYISGVVKGEWIRTNRGRQIQVAKYEEMTPIFNIRLKR